MKEAPVLTFQVREGGSTLVPADIEQDVTLFDSGFFTEVVSASVKKVNSVEPTEA